MKYLIAAMLIVVGVIHLLPLSGVLGADRLSRLYGISFEDNNLAILMRHRAVLFGMLGILLLVAGFRPTLQPLALIAGFISVISFLWLAWSAGAYNANIERVFNADLIVLACLVVAAAAWLYHSFRSPGQ